MPFSNDLLCQALDGVQLYAGNIKIDEIPNPQIIVERLGKIDYPLSKEQARQILSLASQDASAAPRSDGAVGNTTKKQTSCHIDPQSIEFEEPEAWESVIDHLLHVVSRSLNINAPVHAHLSGMSLYGKGASFKVPPDAGEIPYLLGTLVMSLPSPHSGGGINVEIFGEKKIRGETKPPTICTYWRALENVSHKALPVRSGYKWVLTYKLTTMSPLEDPFKIKSPSLHKVIEAWATEVGWTGEWARWFSNEAKRVPPRLYILDNRYPAKNLHLKGLHFRDGVLVRRLKRTCLEFEFGVFLASLELAISTVTTQERLDNYYANGKSGKIAEGYTSWTLRAEGVRSLDGNELLPSIDIDDRWLLEGTKKFRGRPDVCEHNGPIVYAGRSAISMVLRYKVSVLIMMPPMAFENFFTLSGSPLYKGGISGPKAYQAIRWLAERALAYKTRSARQNLLDIIGLVRMEYHPSWRKDKALTRTLCHIATMCDGRAMQRWFRRQGYICPAGALDWLREQYKTSEISIKDLKRSFPDLISGRHRKEQYRMILEFQGRKNPSHEMRELLMHTASKALLDCESGSTSFEDGVWAVDLALYASMDMDCFASEILDTITRPGASFLFGLCHRWYEMLHQNRISGEGRWTAYSTIVSKSLKNMSFLWQSAKDAPAPGSDRKYYESRLASLDAKRQQLYYDQVVSDAALRRFVISLFRSGFEEHQATFANLLINTVNGLHWVQRVRNKGMSGIDTARMKSLWIPLFQDLLKNSETLGMSLTDPTWRQLYRVILHNFLARYEDRPWPELPGSFARGCILCLCTTCTELNDFLANPDEKVRFFRIQGAKLSHITKKLSVDGIDCTCWRERPSNPDVLFFKTNKVAEREWRRDAGREKDVLEYLKGFDQVKLYTILGEDDYLSVMNLTNFEPSPDKETVLPAITIPSVPSPMPVAQAMDWAQLDAVAAEEVNEEMKKRVNEDTWTLADATSANIPEENGEGEPADGPPLWIRVPGNAYPQEEEVNEDEALVPEDRPGQSHHVPLPAVICPIEFNLPTLDMPGSAPAEVAAPQPPMVNNASVGQQQHISRPTNSGPVSSGAPASKVSTNTYAAALPAPVPPPPSLLPQKHASAAPVEPPVKRRRTALPTLPSTRESSGIPQSSVSSRSGAPFLAASPAASPPPPRPSPSATTTTTTTTRAPPQQRQIRRPLATPTIPGRSVSASTSGALSPRNAAVSGSSSSSFTSSSPSAPAASSGPEIADPSRSPALSPSEQGESDASSSVASGAQLEQGEMIEISSNDDDDEEGGSDDGDDDDD